MLGRTHTAAGVLCGLAVLSQTGPVTVIDWGCGCMAAMLASTLPDCDIYDERLETAALDVIKLSAFSFLYLFMKGGKFNPVMILVFAGLLWWGIAAPHRGRTHSFVAMILYSACFYAFIPDRRYTLCFGVAYLSHLALDLLNKKGEKLLWPFNRKGYALYICRADSMVGSAIGVLCTIGIVLFSVFLLGDHYLF